MMYNTDLLVLIDQDRRLFPGNVDPGLYEWFEPDDEILYKKNLKKQPKDWYYRDHKVEYKINSFGYRTKEFDDIDWNNSMVIFGDSIVFGIGICEEDTISGVIEKLTGIPVINLGISGASPIFTLHNSLLLLQSFPLPKYVVFGWSASTRVPYYQKRVIDHLGEWESENKLPKHWSNDVFNGITHTKMSINITRELWKNRSQYYEFSFFNEVADAVGCEFIRYQDSARDTRKNHKGTFDAHPGRETLYSVANKIIKKFNLKIIK